MFKIFFKAFWVSAVVMFIVISLSKVIATIFTAAIAAGFVLFMATFLVGFFGTLNYLKNR